MVLWNGPTDLEKGFIGYLKGKNVPFETEIRDCEGDREKCHALVKDIRAYKPDLIYTWGTPACEEIAGDLNSSSKEYIWNIPIVSLIVTDPVRANLIHSPEAPGRNVTGVNHVAPIEAQLNSMLLYKSDMKKIAAIYNPDETNSEEQVKELIKKAKIKGIEVIALPIATKDGKPDPASINDIVKQAYQEKAEFLYTPPDTFLSMHSDIFIGAANQYKLPTFASTESMYWKGKPLLGMLSKFINVGLFGGKKAYEILIEGKKPSDMPYEKLSRFSYVVSMETAKKVNLLPSIGVLRFAEIL